MTTRVRRTAATSLGGLGRVTRTVSIWLTRTGDRIDVDRARS